MFRTYCMALICGLNIIAGVVNGHEAVWSLLMLKRYLDLPASGINQWRLPETGRISSPVHLFQTYDRYVRDSRSSGSSSQSIPFLIGKSITPPTKMRPVIQTAASGSSVPAQYALILDAFIG
jgi:hypothetical protein